MITLVSVLISSALCLTGALSQYAEPPTLAVIHNRLTPGRTAWDLPADWRSYDGLIAVKDCQDLGTVYTVTWQGHTARMLAYDCAGDPGTRAWMTKGHVIGEIDYYTAQRWGVVGRGLRGALMCRER